MLDSNTFDRLDDDPEVLSMLRERRDLRLYVSDVQLAELAAIPDETRQQRLLGLAKALCFTVSSSGVLAGAKQKHRADASIATLSLARCDALVSDDEGLFEYARNKGVRVLDFDGFVKQYIL
ncbi:hypothetical protein MASR2M29_05650 [Spirochaetota bacterium]